MKIIRATKTLSKTWDSAGAGRWEEARANIEHFSHLMDLPIPDLKYDFDINILKLQIDYFNESEQEARVSGNLCVSQSTLVSKSQSNRYMKHYLKRLLSGCGGRFPESEDYFDNLSVLVELEAFDQRRVPESLKYKMPLRA
ncbi:MAG: hypothetical protein EON89_15015 [Brevundimonas sp.]|nr:MAG: hypothetical protein EON89_15015 [Brevundimonas sp.]